MKLGVASSYTLSGSDNWDDPYLEEDKAYSGQVPALRKLGNLRAWRVIYDISDEQRDYLEHTLSTASLNSTYGVIEDIQEEVRGVFALKHERKTAFTIQFSQKFSEIPRWESKFNMHQSFLEDED